MNRKLLRITLIGLVALVALAATWPALSAAVGFKVQTVAPDGGVVTSGTPASFSGACTNRDSGITLVVDYGSLRNGKPEVRCAINADKSTLTGWGLFAAAGFKVAGTSDYPIGFVCRINGLPTTAQQDCLHTPTSVEGTWQYFTARQAGGWRFSMVGSAMNRPVCGEYQGWRFVRLSEGSGPHLPRFAPTPFVCD
jgi:hypothetical protein